MALRGRSAQLAVRVSEEELGRIRAAADAAGETVAEFVRSAVARRCLPDRDPVLGVQLTRPQRRVLAAVTRNAGLDSVAGVARAAGLSWSATRRALDALSAAEAIRRVEFTQSWRRGVRQHSYWAAAVGSPAYQAMWPQAASVKLPPRPRPQVHVGPLPAQFWSLFWNHPDPSKLRLPDHADYIANRLLNGPSPFAALWASVHLPQEALRSCLTLRSTKPQTRDLINNALAHRRTQPA